MRSLLQKTLGTLLILFLSLFALAQTEWMKRRALDRLNAEMQKSGNGPISIGKIEGIFPFHLRLKEVRCGSWSADAVHLRIDPSALFTHARTISYCRVIGGAYENHPFSLLIKGVSNPFSNLEVDELLIESPEGIVRGSFGLDGRYLPLSCLLEFTFSNPQWVESPLLPVESLLTGSIGLDSNRCLLALKAKQPTWKNGALADLNIHCLIDSLQSNLWKGELVLQGAEDECRGSMQFAFNLPQRILSIDSLNLQILSLILTGNLRMDLIAKEHAGHFHVEDRELKLLNLLFPIAPISGKIEMVAEFTPSHQGSNPLNFSLKCEDLSYRELSIAKASVEGRSSSWEEPYHGRLFIEARDLSHPDFSINDLQLTLSTQEGIFSLFGDGSCQNAPLSIQLMGNLLPDEEGFVSLIHDCYGSALGYPFSLKNPCSLKWDFQELRLTSLSLNVGEGDLYVSCHYSPSHSSLFHLKGELVPIDLLSIWMPNSSITGRADLQVNLVKWRDCLEGEVRCTLQNSELSINKEDGLKLHTRGWALMQMHEKTLQLQTEFYTLEGHQFSIMATLPLQEQFTQDFAIFNPNHPFSLDLFFQGEMEPLAHLVKNNPQSWTGLATARLLLSNTLMDPEIQGTLDLQNGIYTNNVTGTLLKKIHAKAAIRKQKIDLLSFQAEDEEEGRLRVTGEIALSSKDAYPYAFQIELSRFRALESNDLSAKLSGALTLDGSLSSAVLKGALKTTEARIQVPDSITFSPPPFPLLLRNFPTDKVETLNPASHSSPFPLILDIAVKAPKGVLLEGKGLSSEWGGTVHISGATNLIQTYGSLDLIKGDYLLAGKLFTFTEGELIFKGDPIFQSYLTLRGNCELPSTVVTALLQGQLFSPLLQLHSNPQLPTNALFAELLFNKDLSEISPFQAIQLAQFILQVSGKNPPDILQKIRKSLGIDRLHLLTAEEEPGKISLQIGKYLARGVLLSLSQGVENSRLSLEVELKKGMTLFAEMDRQQRSKFSLRWRHHY